VQWSGTAIGSPTQENSLGAIIMAKKNACEPDTFTEEVLNLLDQDIAQGKLIPIDARYPEELMRLVDGVAVDLDQILPNEDGRIH
jgi:hypothetical protein